MRIHVVTQTGDGVVLLVPVVYLIHGAVCRTVITGAMVTNPERRKEEGMQKDNDERKLHFHTEEWYFHTVKHVTL